MNRFTCEVPFLPGETWRRWNFFSLNLAAIDGDPVLVSAVSDNVPQAREVSVLKTSVENGWAAMQEVIQIYVILEAAAAVKGRVLVTIDAGVQGDLIACGAVSDACLPGESG